MFRQVWLFGLMAGAVAIPGISQELNPRFVGARASGTVFVMELAGIGDASCVLEATDDLPGSWTQVALPAPLADGELEVPVDRPQRFFRIRCGVVYSTNRAGYVELELTQGLNLIANPFDNGGNTLPEVLGQDWPFGIAVYQFDPGRQAYSATQYGRSAWLSDVPRMLPGTGAFIEVITPTTLVLGGLFNDSVIAPELAVGWNLVGQTPASSSVIDGQVGDSMARLVGSVYSLHVFEFGEWAAPVLAPRLGEGFWYHRNDPGAVPPAGGCLLFSNFGPVMGSAPTM